MSSLVHTTSESLCKLVRWAHSHGTICNLIPSLQHLTCGSYDTAPPPEPGPHGSGVSVGVWSCDAGHAYNWPLTDHSSSCRGPATVGQGQERFVGGRLSHKGTVRASCDLSCSDAASEAEELSGRLFDIAGCESSATDEDGDYEPRPSRKRGRSAGGAVGGKKVKQETTSAEDFDSAEHASSAATDSVSHTRNTQPHIAQTALLPKVTPHPRAQQGLDLGSEGLVDPVKEMLGGESCATETSEKTAGWQGELEKLQALLNAERSRNQQMAETISSLKQDKELLQSEITKKAELICDFLQDKLRPEKTLHRFSNPVEPGSSHLTSADDGGGFDSPTMFDSFEEMDLHPLEQRTLKSKRSRDGENPRVRMKNVVGVIARYMAALKEFHRSVSMKVAFDRVGVDRNTISRTAAIAELSLAAPEVFHGLVPWNEKEETLAHYAHRCRQAMDNNIKAKIQTMKAKGELLPIVSK